MLRADGSDRRKAERGRAAGCLLCWTSLGSHSSLAVGQCGLPRRMTQTQKGGLRPRISARRLSAFLVTPLTQHNRPLPPRERNAEMIQAS